jgi:hypothetical protein
MNPEEVDRQEREKSNSVDRSQLARTEYADYFEVANDYVAFYVACGQQALSWYDERETTKVYTRIATSPFGAINLLGVLARALCHYAMTYDVFRDDFGRVIPQEKEMQAALCRYVEKFVDKDKKKIDVEGMKAQLDEDAEKR